MTNTISSGKGLQQLASSFQVVHATPSRLRLCTNDISLTALKTFAQIIQKLESIPGYVLAWYAFDSFIKLHGTSPSTTE